MHPDIGVTRQSFDLPNNQDLLVHKVIIPTVLLCYMRKVQRRIPETYNKTLKQLMQQSPDERDTHAFHQLEQDSSVKQYTEYLHRFVTYFVRRQAEYQNLHQHFSFTHFPEAIKSSVLNFYKACKNLIPVLMAHLVRVCYFP